MRERRIPTSEELEQAAAQHKPKLFSRLRHGRLKVKPGAGEAKKVNGPGGPGRPPVETPPAPTPAVVAEPANISPPVPAAPDAPAPPKGRPIKISSTVKEARGAGVRKPALPGSAVPAPTPAPATARAPMPPSTAVPQAPATPSAPPTQQPAAPVPAPPAKPMKSPTAAPARAAAHSPATPPARPASSAPSRLRPPTPAGPGPGSLHDVAGRVLGKVVSGGPQRFSEPAWTHEGGSSVGCADCDGELHVFRRPYESAGKQYRYWGFVCSECAGCFTLDEFDSATQQMLKGENPKPLKREFTNQELVEWALSRACGGCQTSLPSNQDRSGLHPACRKAFEAAQVLRSLSS